MGCPPGGGRCAGPNRQAEPVKAGRLRRKAGGRKRIVQVRLDDAEAVELARRAGAAGVSGPRFLVEAALAGDRETAAERRAILVALTVARRQVSGAAANLNQLARVANSTGRVPAELSDAIVRMDLAVERFEAARDRAEEVTG